MAKTRTSVTLSLTARPLWPGSSGTSHLPYADRIAGSFSTRHAVVPVPAPRDCRRMASAELSKRKRSGHGDRFDTPNRSLQRDGSVPQSH